MVPSTATAITANLTIVGPSANSFVTLWPADAARPVVSSLNFTAGQAPGGNNVTVKLSADGKIKAFNLAGFVDVILDLAGYFEPAAVGAPADPAAPVTIDVGLAASDLAFGAGSVWVVTNLPKEVVRIDTVTNAIVERISLPGDDWSDKRVRLAFGGNRLWAATSTRIWAIDPSTDQITATLDLESIPIRSLENYRGLVFDGAFLWHSACGDHPGTGRLGRVSKIDPTSMSVISEIEITCAAQLFAVGPAVWIPNGWGSSISRIDAVTGAIETFEVLPLYSTGLVAGDAEYLYLSYLNGPLKRYRIADGSVSDFFPASSYGEGPLLLDGTVWLATQGGILEVDRVSGEVLRKVSRDIAPQDWVFDGSTVWALTGKSVTRIDPG